MWFSQRYHHCRIYRSGFGGAQYQCQHGDAREKPKEVGFYVIYTDHWNWDLAVYLDSLDVQFIDNSNGQIIASGSFKNSKIFESWPNPRTKTFEVIDSMFGATTGK